MMPKMRLPFFLAVMSGCAGPPAGTTDSACMPQAVGYLYIRGGFSVCDRPCVRTVEGIDVAPVVTNYYYDDSDRHTHSEFLFPNDPTIITDRFEYAIDRIVSRELKEDSSVVSHQRYEYEDGLIVRTTSDDNQDGRREETTTYVYDDLDRIIDQETRSLSGDLQSSRQVNYDEDLVSQVVYDLDGDGERDVIENYFEVDGRVGGYEVDLDADGISDRRHTFRYDDRGRFSTEEFFDDTAIRIEFAYDSCHR